MPWGGKRLAGAPVGGGGKGKNFVQLAECQAPGFGQRVPSLRLSELTSHP